MKAITLLVISFLSATVLLSSGCGRGEKIVVKYRGRAVIEKTAQVVKDKIAIGYVDETFAETGMQRVVLRLQHANQASSKDRFVPVRDGAGKMGFRIFPGRDGSPLQNGAEIEADPYTERRALLAQPPPVEGAAARSVGSGEPGPAEAPGSAAAQPSGGPPRDFRNELLDRREHRMQQNVGQLLKTGPPPRNVDPELARRFEEFGVSIESGSMEEAKILAQQDGPLLKRDLEAYAADAKQNGNQIAVAETRQLIHRLDLAIRRVSRFTDPRDTLGFPGGRQRGPGEKFQPRQGK